jgi:hypothetical protein
MRDLVRGTAFVVVIIIIIIITGETENVLLWNLSDCGSSSFW